MNETQTCTSSGLKVYCIIILRLLTHQSAIGRNSSWGESRFLHPFSPTIKPSKHSLWQILATNTLLRLLKETNDQLINIKKFSSLQTSSTFGSATEFPQPRLPNQCDDCITDDCKIHHRLHFCFNAIGAVVCQLRSGNWENYPPTKGLAIT